MSRPFSIKAVLTANELCRVLKLKSVADRTCFLNVGLWMDEVCKDEADFNSLRAIVFSLAKEAAGPLSKNKAAVFMSLLKSQLGYIPPSNEKAGPAASISERVREQRRRLLNR